MDLINSLSPILQFFRSSKIGARLETVAKLETKVAILETAGIQIHLIVNKCGLPKCGKIENSSIWRIGVALFFNQTRMKIILNQK